jgi:uncharacterized damage-inducible protein DinB
MLYQILLNNFRHLNLILEQLSADDYSTNLKLLNGSSIGAHVRHILEFYICLSEGFQTGTVNYDDQKRCSILESNPDHTKTVINELEDTFSENTLKNKPIVNIIEFNDQKIISQSSLNRELVYLIEHTIHHYAIINIALQTHFTHVEVPQNFGIAYSTAKQKMALETDHYSNT